MGTLDYLPTAAGKTKLTEWPQPTPMQALLSFMQQELLWAHWYLTVSHRGRKWLLQHRKPKTTAEIEHTLPLRFISHFWSQNHSFLQKWEACISWCCFFTVCLNWNKHKKKIPVDCVFRQVRNFVLNICFSDVQHNKTDWDLENLLNTLLDCPQKQSKQ